MTEEVSLRPITFRPGGSTPAFKGFAKGAGAGLRGQSNQTRSTYISKPKKAPEDVVRYSRDFLLKFMDENTLCPTEVKNLNLDIVISDSVEEDIQLRALQRAAEVVDNRDWRPKTVEEEEPLTRKQEPQKNDQQNSQASQNKTSLVSQPQNINAVSSQRPNEGQKKAEPEKRPPQQNSQPTKAFVHRDHQKIVRAEEKGLQAYKPNQPSGQDRAVKKIKGILNKLTPEMFDRLRDQMVEVISTAEILKSTITMLFENAVAQPTFCAMYAELCSSLASSLPSFPAVEGEGKPILFKRILLNTCQDEFEGTEEAREQLKDIADSYQLELALRNVKMRTLGTVRLISELYRKGVLTEKILLVCIRDLLEARDQEQVPPEENVEAACEMISITGKRLSESGDQTKQNAQKSLDGFLARLERLKGMKELPIRIRFIIRDVLDLKRNKWIPRRETFTAKKIDEVHAAAEAELGIVSNKMMTNLPDLPAQQRIQRDDVNLLPPLRMAEDGWELVSRKGQKALPNGSALLGDYTPPERLSNRPIPAQAAAAAPVVPEKTLVSMKKEEAEEKFKSMIEEYLSSADLANAIECVRDLKADEHMGTLIATVFDTLLKSFKPRDGEMLTNLLTAFVTEKVVSQRVLLEELEPVMTGLPDIKVDLIFAPKLLAKAMVSLIAAKQLELPIAFKLDKVEDTETKRELTVQLLKALESQMNKSELMQKLNDADLHFGAILEATPEENYLEGVSDFLKAENIDYVPM